MEQNLQPYKVTEKNHTFAKKHITLKFCVCPFELLRNISCKVQILRWSCWNWKLQKICWIDTEWL